MSEGKSLRLYVDPAWKREGMHAPFMYPFWGNPNEESSLFAKEMFDTFSFDTSLYTIVDDISSADMVFAPYRHNWLLHKDPALLAECIERSRQAALPLLIDGMGDVEHPVDHDNAYVLRIGGYRFLQEKNRIQVPPAADDLLVRCCEGKLEVRKKNNGTPSVGFAGWAALPVHQAFRTVLKELTTRMRGLVDIRYKACTKGVFWRRRALQILGDSKRITLNLRARTSFSGTSKTAVGNMAALREDFVTTVLASDYALDVRGDANEATRLYEILSLGRIPVILDTERNFPFNEMINYRSFALVVDFRDITKLPDIIADFHARISPSEYEAMQQKARDVFVNYFRIDAQMKHVVRELRCRLTSASA